MMSLAVVALFAACENTEEQTPTNHLTITSENTFNVAAEGENVYVTYTINNPIAGMDVATAIISGEEAIKGITHPSGTLIVIEVKANTSTTKRTAIVNVNYADESASIIINQAAAGDEGGNGNENEGGNGNENEGGNGNEDGDVVDFKAAKFNGYYYGQKYGEGSDRYVFFLSEKGMNNAGQAYPNSVYYYVDAFGPVATEGAPYTLPNGTYTWDPANTGAPYTINSEDTQMMLTTDSEVENIIASDAKLIVEDGKLTLEMTVQGKLHKVVYTGATVLDDLTDEGGNGNEGGNEGGNDDPTAGQDKDAQSTLEGDYVVTFPDTPRAKWVYEGDWWKTGYSNYTVMIMNKYNGYVTGDTLQLDLITDNTGKDGDFYGTYEISYTPGKNIAMAGFSNETLAPVGCWYFEYGGASYKNFAMLIDGSVTITDNGDGTSTVILDAYDCYNHHVTCTWSGVIEED